MSFRSLGEIEGEFRAWPLLAGWPYGPGSLPAAPRVEIFEVEGRVVVRAEVAGLTAGDVDVQISDGTLTIRGEYREQREEQGRSFFVCEREYGSLFRSVILPVEVDAERLEWTVSDGLLTASVPRR